MSYPVTIPEIRADIRMGLCSVEQGALLARNRRALGLCDTCDRWNDQTDGNPFCSMCEAQDEAIFEHCPKCGKPNAADVAECCA
jgi:endogenous inhibitor of DNA gyrase (YacG/DUF329 family)